MITGAVVGSVPGLVSVGSVTGSVALVGSVGSTGVSPGTRSVRSFHRVGVPSGSQPMWLVWG